MGSCVKVGHAYQANTGGDAEKATRTQQDQAEYVENDTHRCDPEA